MCSRLSQFGGVGFCGRVLSVCAHEFIRSVCILCSQASRQLLALPSQIEEERAMKDRLKANLNNNVNVYNVDTGGSVSGAGSAGGDQKNSSTYSGASRSSLDVEEGSFTSSIQLLPIRPLEDERRVCAYAFDVRILIRYCGGPHFVLFLNSVVLYLCMQIYDDDNDDNDDRVCLCVFVCVAC